METNADALKLRAYHESGHAVIAYLSGFSCNCLEITKKDPLSNPECYSLGKSDGLIHAMEKYRESPEIFDNVPQVVKITSRKTALKTIIVLLAGQAAEKVFINGGLPVVNPALNLAGEDIKPADNIDYYLSVVKNGQHPMNYLKIVFRQVAELISSKEVWTALSMLAEALFISPQKKLEKNEIEKILYETGYMSYLAILKTKGTGPIQSQQKSNEQQTENPDVAPEVKPETPPEVKQETSFENKTVEPSFNEAPTMSDEPEISYGPKGFSREELLKMKEEIKKRPKRNVITKKEGISKIASFAKGHKFVNFKIGMVDSLQQLRNIDKARYVAFDVKSHAEARDILMYFVCMGMEVSPGSTQNKHAASIFVVMDELL